MSILSIGCPDALQKQLSESLRTTLNRWSDDWVVRAKSLHSEVSSMSSPALPVVGIADASPTDLVSRTQETHCDADLEETTYAGADRKKVLLTMSASRDAGSIEQVFAKLLFGETAFESEFLAIAADAKNDLIKRVLMCFGTPAAGLERCAEFSTEGADWRDRRLPSVALKANLKSNIESVSLTVLVNAHLSAAIGAPVPRSVGQKKLSNRALAAGATKVRLESCLGLAGIPIAAIRDCKPGEVLLSSTKFGSPLSISINQKKHPSQFQLVVVGNQRALKQI